MVHISVIQSQLTRLGIHMSRWFTPELKELQHLMMDNEKIIAAAPGRYFSGLALLVATDLRLLLIDKRTFFMTIEDTRYDMVSEIDFSSRFYDVTVHIFTLNKQHNFTSIRYKTSCVICAIMSSSGFGRRAKIQQNSTPAPFLPAECRLYPGFTPGAAERAAAGDHYHHLAASNTAITAHTAPVPNRICRSISASPL